MAQNSWPRFNLMGQALRDYNVQILPIANLQTVPNREAVIWTYIDRPMQKEEAYESALKELALEEIPLLAFPIRYQLEVCISHGFLNEFNLSRGFLERLMALGMSKAQDLLEHVANEGKRIFDPMTIFSIRDVNCSASRHSIPHYCAVIRSATVTPSTIYYETPKVETSNRVIRQYAEHADRFLRVRFTDEDSNGKIRPTERDTMNEVFTRIKRTMQNGITLGDRRYEFLASGNSQFREGGATFFAPLPYLTTGQMRTWMGMFADIKSVALHAARLGQCFSTTRAISGTKTKVKEIEDIERNGCIFTDGVGKISPFLARLTASELGLMRTLSEPPSVFQFRHGGCKGVLAIAPEIEKNEIHIRKSQYKFPTTRGSLEVVRWSQFAAANLNRQLILVLSALGVQDEVFLSKQRDQLSNLEKAMTDEKTALALLQKYIDPNGMTLTLAGMVIDGFNKVCEPFMVSLLRLWRAWSIKYLKEKARILISQGAFLLGCVDETGTLRGHFNNTDHLDRLTKERKTDQSENEEVAHLPEVFVQLSKGPNDRPHVVLGTMILARNPSLHPGDVRVVHGVDVPALHHLKDVVVVPQTGDTPLVSMCSGGDLDGDDYLVVWDKDMIPQEWNHEPMDYQPPAKVEVDRVITADDLSSFFVTYMKNDNLPAIAHAHLALADFMDEGVKDSRCKYAWNPITDFNTFR
ncbi:MAG: hypothetical protein Q9190_006368 [Brigantiaea leucoxantha]